MPEQSRVHEVNKGVGKIIYHVDPSKTYTTAFVHSDRYAGIGTAKRNPIDAYDEQRGMDIALSRALRDIANAFERGAFE